MFYPFPIIQNINDVLPAIEGRDEFSVTDKNLYTVINYHVAFEDTFPIIKSEEDALRRECRGIIFDNPTGNIIARRFHKFFNLNERHETMSRNVDFGNQHTILEKMDGSMITPFITNDGILRWGTKMGETDVSAPVATFTIFNPNYNEFSKALIDDGYTPIFEWCSRKQRIVIDYPQDRLVCIAIRNMYSGEYMSYEEMERICEEHSVECVSLNTSLSLNDVDSFLDAVKSMESIEGFVIRFDNGHMIKTKTEEYLKYHKAISFLSFEKDILRLVVDSKTDDIKAVIDNDVRKLLEEYEKSVLESLRSYAVHLHWEAVAWTDNNGFSKKKYAVDFVNNEKNGFNSVERSLLFLIIDEEEVMPVEEIFSLLIELVKKNTSSYTKVEEIRFLIGPLRWMYGVQAEVTNEG